MLSNSRFHIGYFPFVEQISIFNQSENYLTQDKMTDGVCIRNKKSGLVLDMYQYEVTLQYYNGSPSQLWDLEGFLIRSKQNG
jgi:hypothetical protein